MHVNNQKQNILITGGAGFIGKHLCRHLSQEGWPLYIYDNFSTSSRESFVLEFGDKIKIIEDDITDIHAFKWALGEIKADIIIHLAAQVSVQESMKNPEFNNRINILGTENIIEAAIHHKVKKLIFSSSAAVYGTLEPPLREEAIEHKNPGYERTLLSPYAVSKYEGEKLIMNSNLNYTIFRIFNIYGEGQSITGGYPAVITAFIDRIKHSQKIRIYGDGSQTRDFIYTGDLVRGFQLSIEKPEITGIFNLASGIGTKVADLIPILEAIVGKKIETEFLPARDGDIYKSQADIRKICTALDFSAKISLDEGLRRLLQN